MLTLDEDTGIQYYFSMEEDDLSIEADEKLLVQVLINLIQNAQHAISEKWVIKIHVSNVDGDKIQIADNGVGIKAEDINYSYIIKV